MSFARRAGNSSWRIVVVVTGLLAVAFVVTALLYSDTFGAAESRYEATAYAVDQGYRNVVLTKSHVLTSIAYGCFAYEVAHSGLALDENGDTVNISVCENALIDSFRIGWR